MSFATLPEPINQPQCWSCLKSLEFSSLHFNGVGQLPWCADCWDRIPPAQRITLMQQYLKFLQEMGPESEKRKTDMHNALLQVCRMVIRKLLSAPDEALDPDSDEFDPDFWKKGR